MSVKNWFAASVIVAGLSLAALPVLAQQQEGQQSGDPVADAARRSREQQKTAPKPKKVYTDDDVKPATPSNETGSTAAAGGAQATPDSGQGAAAGGTGTGKDDAETTWRKRFADQHEEDCGGGKRTRHLAAGIREGAGAILQ